MDYIKIKNMYKYLFIRVVSYIIIWQIYLLFMSNYAPLGTDWLSWHAQRIYNFSEYLKLNGFFSSYGFSIWSQCEDCSLNLENWQNKIYLSVNIFSIFPYVIINDFFGSNNLKLYGHLFDKFIILLSGILLSELLIFLSTKKIGIDSYLKSILIFIFFIINPWTYKMILGFWPNIFFISFFLLGILTILNKRYFFGLLFFLIAGFFDYQSSAGLVLFYILILLFSYFKNKFFILKDYIPSYDSSNSIQFKIIISFLIPVLSFFIIKIIATNEMDNLVGTSLLYRIGIVGNDFHNGGIFGAIQFLGGNRITQCLINSDIQINSMDINSKIYIFNCILSTLSMFFISLISILGLFFSLKNEKIYFNLIIFPMLFLLLLYTFILQQSSSVHLMGYSYFFSILFSVGITSLIFKILEKFQFSLLSILIISPVTIGIFLLCIRINMMTGING